MRKRTVAILLVVAAVLVPTWFAAMQSGHHVEEVGIDTDETAIRPLQAIVETPNALTPAQVGVIVWIALGVLLGMLVVVHRFMDRGVRSADSTPLADGGVPAWVTADDRRVVEYVGAVADDRGLAVVLALSIAVVSFSALTVTEFVTLARTQYVGVYVGGMFFGLAGLAVAYYAWFVPHVTVAEERYHE
ncbi:MAG: hypothetical protein ABEJ58_08835 [Halodesulfurarchaeum sp.]